MTPSRRVFLIRLGANNKSTIKIQYFKEQEFFPCDLIRPYMTSLSHRGKTIVTNFFVLVHNFESLRRPVVSSVCSPMRLFQCQRFLRIHTIYANIRYFMYVYGLKSEFISFLYYLNIHQFNFIKNHN